MYLYKTITLEKLRLKDSNQHWKALT